jgi:hypothetical protein
MANHVHSSACFLDDFHSMAIGFVNDERTVGNRILHLEGDGGRRIMVGQKMAVLPVEELRLGSLGEFDHLSDVGIEYLPRFQDLSQLIGNTQPDLFRVSTFGHGFSPKGLLYSLRLRSGVFLYTLDAGFRRHDER